MYMYIQMYMYCTLYTCTCVCLYWNGSIGGILLIDEHIHVAYFDMCMNTLHMMVGTYMHVHVHVYIVYRSTFYLQLTPWNVDTLSQPGFEKTVSTQHSVL